MSKFRVPQGPAPCPVRLVFPPEHGGLGAWHGDRLAWHQEHAVAGASELGTSMDLMRARTAARLLQLAAQGELDPRQAIPMPPPWPRRWQERPAWLRTLRHPPPIGLRAVR